MIVATRLMHSTLAKMKSMKFAILLLLLALACASHAASAITPGAYRVDVNGKTRELCVDQISNDELSAKGWQQRLSEQGVRCTLQNAKRGAVTVAVTKGWSATCTAPGMGRVYNTNYRVSLKVNADQSFEIVTLLSGDLQAKILIIGRRLLKEEGGGACTSQHETFRPWQ